MPHPPKSECIPVSPGTVLAIGGAGTRIENASTDNLLLEIAGEEPQEWTVPEGTHAIRVIGDDATVEKVEGAMLPRRVIQLPPGRILNLICEGSAGSVVAYGSDGKEITRVSDGYTQFESPQDGHVELEFNECKGGISEAVLTARVFEPELEALNAKLAKYGFFLGFPKMARANDYTGDPKTEVLDVALARQEINAGKLIRAWCDDNLRRDPNASRL